MNFRLLNLRTLLPSVYGLCLFLLTGCESRVESANFSTGMNAAAASTPEKALNTTTSSQQQVKGKIKISCQLLDQKKGGPLDIDADGYYLNPDTHPLFKGGKQALEKYVISNMEPLVYPGQSERIVNVQFGIDENGTVEHVSVPENDAGYGLEEEAVKLVLNMPAWTPATVQGRAVKTRQTLEINYRLETD